MSSYFACVCQDYPEKQNSYMCMYMCIYVCIYISCISCVCIHTCTHTHVCVCTIRDRGREIVITRNWLRRLWRWEVPGPALGKLETKRAGCIALVYIRRPESQEVVYVPTQKQEQICVPVTTKLDSRQVKFPLTQSWIFSSYLQPIECCPSILGRAICLIQSTESNANFIEKQTCWE